MTRLSLFFVCALFFSLGCGDDSATTDAATDSGADSSTADSGADSGTADSGTADSGTDSSTADSGTDSSTADSGTDSATADSGVDAAGRTIVELSEDACARRFGTCTQDSDCMPTGCGAETCAPEPLVTTCDCVRPSYACGCVDGQCAWYR